MESPPVDPVKPENKTAFNEIKSSTLLILSGDAGNETAKVSEPEMHLLMKPFFMK